MIIMFTISISALLRYWAQDWLKAMLCFTEWALPWRRLHWDYFDLLTLCRLYLASLSLSSFQAPAGSLSPWSLSSSDPFPQSSNAAFSVCSGMSDCLAEVRLGKCRTLSLRFDVSSTFTSLWKSFCLGLSVLLPHSIVADGISVTLAESRHWGLQTLVKQRSLLRRVWPSKVTQGLGKYF